MNSYVCFKLVVSFFLVGSYFFLPKYGFTAFWWDGCHDIPTYTNHLLYPLSHASIWHLAANILCLWMLRCPLHLFITYAIAVACSFLPSFAIEPTYGYSGVLFAMVGISWGKVHRFRDMLWKNKWILIVPAFIPHINFLIHIYCLLAGYLYGRYATRD